MKGTGTLQKYRAIDLTLFAAMLMIFETVATHAAVRLFPREAYAVSVTPAITAIVLMRWGPWAAIHAALGALAYCRAVGAPLQQYVIYGAGNLLSLAALALLKALGKENVRGDALKTLLFGLCTALLMQLGRAAVSLLFGMSLPAAALFVTADGITLLFTLVILWIARRLDGVLEDQRHYLLRLQKERDKEEGGFR